MIRSEWNKIIEITKRGYYFKSVSKKKRCYGPIKVVFLIDYLPSWGKVEAVYYEMIHSGMFDVTLLVLAGEIVEYKNNILKFCDKMKTNSRVELVDLEMGRIYDLRRETPDYVFYLRPYNIYLPEYYQSGIVQQYSRICYVSYGYHINKVQSEDGGENELFKMTYPDDFMKDVRLFFADSSDVAKANKDRYNSFHRWGLMKTFDLGYPSFASVMKYKKLTRGGFSTFEKRKKILWCPRWTTDMSAGGGSSFFLFKDKILELSDKYKSEVGIVIRPHPKMFENFLATGEMTNQELDQYKAEVERRENVILDNTDSYYKTMWESDVLLSDFSSILPEYFLTGKPIIFYCGKDIAFSNCFEEIKESFYNVKDWDEVESVILTLLFSGNDEKEKLRKKLRDTFFENVEAVPKRIVEAIISDYRASQL